MERWVIVVGERRYRAAVQAGLTSLVCIEATAPATPEDVLEDQLVENALRSDLKPIEQAHAYRTLLNRRGWSHRQLAESLRISPGSVAKALALLELPGEIREQVEQGSLAAATAYELSKIEDPAEQSALASRVVAEGLTVTEAAKAVRHTSGQSSKAKGRGAGKSKKVTSLSFRVAAGGKVTVEFKRGLDDALIADMLRDALRQVELRMNSGEQAAA